MLEELGELPKQLDALVEAIIGFLYAFLRASVTIWKYPRYGAVRVHAAQKIPSAPTLLFVSACLLAMASLVTPDEYPGATKNELDVARWLLYAAVIFLFCDGLIAGWLWFERLKTNRRLRAQAILRYSVSGVLLGWTVSACAHRFVDSHLAALLHIPLASLVISEYLPFFFAWWPLLGLVGTLSVVTPSLRTSPLTRGLRLVPSLIVVTALCAISSMKGVPSHLETFGRAMIASEKTQEKSAPAPTATKPQTHIDVQLMTCRGNKQRDATVTAVLVNDSENAIALDTHTFKIMVSLKNASILNPTVLPMVPNPTANAAVLIVAAHGAAPIEGTFALPQPSQLAENPQCNLFYSGGVNSSVNLDGQSLFIQDTQSDTDEGYIADKRNPANRGSETQPSTDRAAALAAQANLVYEQQRAATCETSPKECAPR
ncbi:hypothetical protein [Paraburkholderia sp. JHI869]|uniref:hypothetical protein n=1 Tax=Paraburkholderia sp. JHI869 TaxID=3112959 RepID=UPI00317634DB